MITHTMVKFLKYNQPSFSVQTVFITSVYIYKYVYRFIFHQIVKAIEKLVF